MEQDIERSRSLNCMSKQRVITSGGREREKHEPCSEPSVVDEDAAANLVGTYVPCQDETACQLIEDTKLAQISEVATVTTADDKSWDSSLKDQTTYQVCSEQKQMTVLVNGTRYVGNISPTTSSICVRAEDCDEALTERGEILKLRNRCLLIQDREFRTRRSSARESKRAGFNSKPVVKLRAIDEGHATDDNSSVAEGGSGVDIVNKCEQQEVTCGDRRTEIESILKAKKILPRGCFRVRSRTRTTIRRTTAGVKKIGVYCHSSAPRVFAVIIQMYSSSASRYAMFKSNLSFKPGD